MTLYYAVSRFARQKFIEGGFPANRVVVKPNFVEADPGVGSGRGGYAVYAGRLSEEKGVAVLLDAWSRLDEPLPLKIIGDGPLSSQVEEASARDSRIEYLGHLRLAEVHDAIGEAAFLIMPSIWYEPFGRTIIEAYAKGTPVIGSRIGAVAELVLDGETGCHFEAGSPDDLVAKMKDLLCRPKRLAQMRRAARCRYEAEYTAETHYTCLMETYEKVLEAKA